MYIVPYHYAQVRVVVHTVVHRTLKLLVLPCRMMCVRTYLYVHMYIVRVHRMYVYSLIRDASYVFVLGNEERPEEEAQGPRRRPEEDVVPCTMYIVRCMCISVYIYIYVYVCVV